MSEPAPFANEPVLELRRAPVRGSLADALAEFDGRGPAAVPVWIGDEQREGSELRSTDPGVPDREVAVAAIGTRAEVDAAVAVAARGSGSLAWRRAPARTRAGALIAAAAVLRSRRLELAVLQVRECAKPWPEADADVCEAIDFLEYYARGALALADGRPIMQVSGERNELRYVPRGVVAVISPWNFPLAIPCGMTAAALATGNSVVLKPAEQSPGCALALVQALRGGGVPADAISLVPGLGETGAALVEHPGVHAIAFTGSQQVGLEIVARAAAPVRGRRHITHVVAELGGKNCVIVDADADLDEAVPAIVSSAFHYAGQKCSAASRVLVHEAIAEELSTRVAGAVQLLVVGQAEQLGTEVPPVIERSAQERVRRYAAIAERDGRVLATGGGELPASGFFCAPTVAAGLPPGSEVLEQEIFGPVLTIEPVRDVRHACEVVDALPFALTGGLFTRNPRTVREVRELTPVGNLYVNRGITGAMVGRQPFGGNRLSGTGTKAGGPDYLLQFVEPRAVTENTMRHGLDV